MNLINNLIFTALNDIAGFGPINPRFMGLSAPLQNNLQPVQVGQFYTYGIDVNEEFCAFDDPDFIENAIQKHWTDMVNGRNYENAGNTYTSFKDLVGDLIPAYHLIYAYLVENTRIAQIFERLLQMYMQDEKLNKATTQDNRIAFQWMMNTENLFFKNLSNTSYRNISSQFRGHPEANRRNAYFRMFGMDLAFGDLTSNASINYHKAEFNNKPFIVLFEKFLSEIWQAYTNAKNSIGPNTTDSFVIVDTARKIQELLMSRRTTETNFNNYRYFNLSKEEYASVVMMSWLFEVISYESPVVQFLRCNGGSPGERLINIGNKVGVNAHSKSEGLLEIAPAMNTLLRRIELKDYSDEAAVNIIIKSEANNLPNSDPNRAALNDLLRIINNWEKATGHRIKNPGAPSVNGMMKIQQNGVKQEVALN
ncbi:hypothetical protein BH23BAC1_BH23BAC1_05100 [soil metagenome]